MIDLFAPGAYARTAGGNLERPNEQRLAVEWMAWSLNPDNGAGGGRSAWAKARPMWRAAGIKEFPWLHVRSIPDLARLITVAEEEDSPAIGLNIEDVARDFPGALPQVAGYVRDFWFERYGKPVHMATLPWVQNGQGWHHLAFAVAALEIMPDEQLSIFPGGRYDSAVTRACVEHAFAEGLRNVTLMFKTKAPLTRETYGDEYAYCRSLYTADDVGVGEAAWRAWSAPAPCRRPSPPAPPTPPEVPMLSEKVVPYTGPLYGPSRPNGPSRAKTVQGLKRAMIRLGYLDQKLGSETPLYGPDFEAAMKRWQRDLGFSAAGGQYGRDAWLAIRRQKVPPGRPSFGQYALDGLSRSLIQADAVRMCHPIVAGASFTICQDLHPTLGLTGNYALDFCARAGTKVLAVERATIKKLSGHDPRQGPLPGGIFGWSIHYETPNGYRYFSTHYGARQVKVGQLVEVGQVLGTVGDWPGNAHLHLGVTSPLGIADAKKRMTEIRFAPRLAA